jgi:hypothetical protein
MIKIIFDLSQAVDNDQALAKRLAGMLQKSVRMGAVEIEFANVPEHAPAVPVEQQDSYISMPVVGTVDRIDFVPLGSKCFHCHRPLTSGTGYWVKFPSAEEKPFGGTCVAKYFPSIKSAKVPNFTRAAFCNPNEDGTTEVAVKTAPTKPVCLIEEEYIRLRYERMPEFNIPKFPPLDARYEKLRSGKGFEESDQIFIRNLLDKLPASKMPGLSLENLQTCYAYAHCLTQAIESLPEDKRDYLAKLRSDLQKKLYLTGPQIEAANKWLAKIKGVPVLDAAPFSWAEK